MERHILAVDPAATCGFAHSNGQRGIWILGEHRLSTLYDNLFDVWKAWGLDVLALEEAGFGAGPGQLHTMAMHNELRGVLKLAADRIGAEVVTYVPSTIKKFATGSGSAKKDQMVRACRTMLGIVAQDDNVADACFILEMAKQGYQPPPSVKTKAKRERRAKAGMATLFDVGRRRR